MRAVKQFGHDVAGCAGTDAAYDTLAGVSGADFEGGARVFFHGFEDVRQGGVFGVDEELAVDVRDFRRDGGVVDGVSGKRRRGWDWNRSGRGLRNLLVVVLAAGGRGGRSPGAGG
jgi:hypothetical protein